MHLYEHKVSFVGQAIRYLLIIIGVIAFGASVCFIDGYLKCKTSGADGTRIFTSRPSLGEGFFEFVENCVDFGSLMRIQAIILPICIWSLYYSLIGQKNKVSNLDATIEVLGRGEEDAKY